MSCFNVLLLSLSLAYGETSGTEGPPDVALSAVQHRIVTIVERDGAQITGQLLAFDTSAVVLRAEGGQVRTIQRAAIDSITVAAGELRADREQGTRVAIPEHDSVAIQREKIAELRAESAAHNAAGIRAFVIGLPLGGGLAVVGALAATNGDSSTQATGWLGVTVGAGMFLYGCIALPVESGKSTALDEQADALEAELGSSGSLTPRTLTVAPFVADGGGGLLVTGSF